ncbi:hypothetical protein K7X08_032041 [Anisodus acutangulus]|uniref:Uncharacterized protein n=1 Tax=Anisodus acutangulus TaxID=402998 RepID=A0A9Q1MNB2_9SOLA|nr:hypothetical protein K7X08_032041 [Anisodus acutangulus]
MMLREKLINFQSVAGKSIMDYLTYYGVRLGGEDGFCRIVMDRGLAAYGTVDVDGNVILSRDIPASVLKLFFSLRYRGLDG